MTWHLKANYYHMNLHPLPGYVLVELPPSRYKHVAAPTKAYESKTSGVVIAIGEEYPDDHELIGKQVFWQEFKEGSSIPIGDKTYAFVPMDELQGYADAPSN